MFFVFFFVEVEKVFNFLICLIISGDENVMFKIDNLLECQWQFRNIERYVWYMERERVYFVGVKFEVIKRIQDEEMKDI